MCFFSKFRFCPDLGDKDTEVQTLKGTPAQSSAIETIRQGNGPMPGFALHFFATRQSSSVKDEERFIPIVSSVQSRPIRRLAEY